MKARHCVINISEQSTEASYKELQVYTQVWLLTTSLVLQWGKYCHNLSKDIPRCPRRVVSIWMSLVSQLHSIGPRIFSARANPSPSNNPSPNPSNNLSLNPLGVATPGYCGLHAVSSGTLYWLVLCVPLQQQVASFPDWFLCVLFNTRALVSLPGRLALCVTPVQQHRWVFLHGGFVCSLQQKRRDCLDM